MSEGGLFQIGNSELESLLSSETPSGTQFRKLKLDPEDDLKLAIASAWNFPDYYGHNWDALVDCWSSMEGDQFITVISGNVKDLPILESVARVIADRYRQSHRAFAVLVSD